MTTSYWTVITFALLAVVLIQAAPTAEDLESKIKELQAQLNFIQNSLNKRDSSFGNSEVEPGQPLQRNARYMSFQPLKKRMVSWQPMKRNAADFSKEQVIRAIEEQLSEILRAGETLGVNADEVLNHLRQRNAGLV